MISSSLLVDKKPLSPNNHIPRKAFIYKVRSMSDSPSTYLNKSNEIVTYIQDNNIDVIEVFEEKLNKSSKKRPELTRLLSKIKMQEPAECSVIMYNIKSLGDTVVETYSTLEQMTQTLNPLIFVEGTLGSSYSPKVKNMN